MSYGERAKKLTVTVTVRTHPPITYYEGDVGVLYVFECIRVEGGPLIIPDPPS